MKLASILLVLVIVSATDSVERARRSNRLMWWRVRMQLLTIALIMLWYFASRA
jgi:hypothetical protein